MRLVVLMQAVHDARLPVSPDEVAAWQAGAGEAHPAFGPYDENALETALQLKGQQSALQVSVLSLTARMPEELVRSALAAGADEALTLVGDAWSWPPMALARQLAHVVSRFGDVAGVLAGVQSGDFDSGLVPAGVAAWLGWPWIPFATDVRWEAGQWQFTFRGENGTLWSGRTGEAFVASITSSGHNALRYPTMRDRLMAKRKPWTQEPAKPEREIALRLEPAATGARHTTWIEGSDDRAEGIALVEELRARRWI